VLHESPLHELELVQAAKRTTLLVSYQQAISVIASFICGELLIRWLERK
jgi:hypothetical protein